MKYTVSATETTMWDIVVEANSPDEANAIALSINLDEWIAIDNSLEITSIQPN
jgi:hypothetical protein